MQSHRTIRRLLHPLRSPHQHHHRRGHHLRLLTPDSRVLSHLQHHQSNPLITLLAIRHLPANHYRDHRLQSLVMASTCVGHRSLVPASAVRQALHPSNPSFNSNLIIPKTTRRHGHHPRNHAQARAKRDLGRAPPSSKRSRRAVRDNATAAPGSFSAITAFSARRDRVYLAHT